MGWGNYVKPLAKPAASIDDVNKAPIPCQENEGIAGPNMKLNKGDFGHNLLIVYLPEYNKLRKIT